ncbi:MAG: WG repeat-containing protein [Lentisphaerae bacterium]|nr:WG repeat-containing protein [Lentisphaerota bacterium]
MDLHDFDKIEKCGNIVFAENNFRLVKLWQLDNVSVWEDNDTGLFIINFHTPDGKWGKYCAVATPGGTYLTTEVFEGLDEFHNGMATIYYDGKGYGYINSAGKVIYPPEYEKAENFSHGHACAVKNGKKYLLDKSGNAFIFSDKYKLSGSMHYDRLPVSTLLMPQVELSLWSDEDFLAGEWGYIDGKGKEIIAPQYLYANNFIDGLAVVCKGKWKVKSDNSYWCDEQLWGVIDINGNEVIPCRYEGIKVFDNTSEFYRVCSNGK